MTILTNSGLAKLASATPEDQLRIASVAAGDGSGGYPPIDPTMTALVNEVWRGDSSDPIRDPDDDRVLIFEGVIPANVGDFVIREVGLFDEDDDLIAIGQVEEIAKPSTSTGSPITLTIRVRITMSNASETDLIIGDAPAVDHQGTTNRDANDAHPIDAITDLRPIVDSLITPQWLPSDRRYVWYAGSSLSVPRWVNIAEVTAKAGQSAFFRIMLASARVTIAWLPATITASLGQSATQPPTCNAVLGGPRFNAIFDPNTSGLEPGPASGHVRAHRISYDPVSGETILGVWVRVEADDRVFCEYIGGMEAVTTIADTAASDLPPGTIYGSATYEVNWRVLNDTINSQSWVDESPNRYVNADFTNDTGRPISVRVNAESSSTTGPEVIDIIVGGVTIGRQTIPNDGDPNHVLQFAVPDGQTYQLSTSATNSILTRFWFELK